MTERQSIDSIQTRAPFATVEVRLVGSLRLGCIDSIQTRAPFATLFPIDPRVLDALTENMRTVGFDPSKPLDVWDGVVIDGHTRLQAAKAAGLSWVRVYEHDFEDEDAALEYAIRNQRDRRNLSDDDLLRCVKALDQRKARGGDHKSEAARSITQDCVIDPQPRPSSAQTAELLGISPRKVEQIRTVLDHADQPTREAVATGEKTINQAYRETQERRRAVPEAEQAAPVPAPGTNGTVVPVRAAPAPTTFSVGDWEALPHEMRLTAITDLPDPKATFNRTNDNVEWALWTWNPVTGCDHGCAYCYARDIANRFYPQGFAPTFLPARLHAPRHMKVPAAAAENVGERNVFVCSMADLFGKWVPQDWIDAVFTEVKGAPDWNFLFLTKFPQRLAELDWPDNAWVGTTVDTQARVANAERSFQGVRAGVKWLSCEPLLERLTFTSLAMFDWIVIGGSSASTQTKEFQPPWEWVEHLIWQAREAGCQVYLKPNLKTRPREYPTAAAVRA